MSRLIELVLLLALVALVAWPVRRTGEKFLVRWGIARPTRAQSEAAARYLRHRRMLYPICWVFGPALVLLVAELAGDSAMSEARRTFGLLASVLAALLLAELVAILRPARGSTRSATLSRRRWSDLVPWWAIAVYGVLLVTAALLATAGLVAHSWAVRSVAAAAADPGNHTDPVSTGQLVSTTGNWLDLLGVALGLAAVGAVLWLAASRRAEADPEVDRILRVRTARVAVGVGIGLALGLVNHGYQHISELHNLIPSILYGTGAAPLAPPEPGVVTLAAHLDGLGMIVLLFASLGAWLAVAIPPSGPLTPAPIP